MLSAASLLMRRHPKDVNLPVLLVEALLGSCDGQVNYHDLSSHQSPALDVDLNAPKFLDDDPPVSCNL